MTIDDPEFMTVPEIAKLLRVSKMTVYRMINTGELPAVNIGKRNFRVRAAEVRKLL